MLLQQQILTFLYNLKRNCKSVYKQPNTKQFVIDLSCVCHPFFWFSTLIDIFQRYKSKTVLSHFYKKFTFLLCTGQKILAYRKHQTIRSLNSNAPQNMLHFLIFRNQGLHGRRANTSLVIRYIRISISDKQHD